MIKQGHKEMELRSTGEDSVVADVYPFLLSVKLYAALLRFTWFFADMFLWCGVSMNGEVFLRSGAWCYLVRCSFERLF